MREKEITHEEAVDFIKEWPSRDDFINQHFRLVGFEGDDNSIDLAYYWKVRKEIADPNYTQSIDN